MQYATMNAFRSLPITVTLAYVIHADTQVFFLTKAIIADYPKKKLQTGTPCLLDVLTVREKRITGHMPTTLVQNGN